MNAGSRRALVTGGSGGIGAAICRRLAAAGHVVHVHAHRSVHAAEAIVARICAGHVYLMKPLIVAQLAREGRKCAAR